MRYIKTTADIIGAHCSAAARLMRPTDTDWVAQLFLFPHDKNIAVVCESSPDGRRFVLWQEEIENYLRLSKTCHFKSSVVYYTHVGLMT